MHGSAWTIGPEHSLATITEARRWAEGLGSAGDRCMITRYAAAIAQCPGVYRLVMADKTVRGHGPLHVPARGPTPFQVREHTFRILVDSDASAGSYSAMHIESPVSTGPNPHVHEEAEEGFYLLDGEVTFYVGDAVIEAQPGDWVHVPRGITHHFRVGGSPARYLAIYAPAGDEQLFRDAAADGEAD